MRLLSKFYKTCGVILVVIFLLAGYSNFDFNQVISNIAHHIDSSGQLEETLQPDEDSSQNSGTTELPSSSVSIDLSAIPPYDGEPYTVINNDIPFFTADEITTDTFEYYSPLDELGRCGVAYANICTDLMPTDDRESISSVTPSGWNNHSYDFVDNNWVYNRCHIIGFQLAGENANEQNLITGTRYMNVEGMLPYENEVADYVRQHDGDHVLYRVTPMYDGDNLVASGVLMEAYSVEDDGQGVCFNVFCYNVQPGVTIDYSTGENRAA